MTARTTLTFGLRYSHISNADLGKRNFGLDAVLPYVGVFWFLLK